MKTHVPSKYRRNEFKDLVIDLVKLFEPKVFVSLRLRSGWIFDEISPLVKTAYAVSEDSRVILRSNVITHMTSSKAFFSFLQKIHHNEEFLDMVLIENHNDRDRLLADVEGVAPWVKMGTGLILIHNTYPINEALASDDYCGNAWEAARTIHQMFHNTYEIVTLPGPWAGLSIIRKVLPYGEHLAWRHIARTKKGLEYDSIVLDNPDQDREISEEARDRLKEWFASPLEAMAAHDSARAQSTLNLTVHEDPLVVFRSQVQPDGSVTDTKIFVRGEELDTPEKIMKFFMGGYCTPHFDTHTDATYVDENGMERLKPQHNQKTMEDLAAAAWGLVGGMNEQTARGDLLDAMDVSKEACDVEGADRLRGDNPDTESNVGN